jgi:hypothetical protein
MFGAVRANFPTTHSTEHPAGGNFTAMTYLNQTSGPGSYLMMHVRASGFTFGYNYAFSHMTFFYDVSVRGALARNIRPVGLEFRTNVTGSAIAIGFHNNWYQGPNVISDPQQTFGFWNNGTGTLTATLTNWGGSGPLYEFEYRADGQSDMRNYRYTQFIGFRATLSAWMLPPISVGVVMEISNIPKTLTLVPKGTAVTVYGYNETRFDPSTLAPFTVTGAFNASSPVTAYLLNLSERAAWGGYSLPTVFHWKSPLGTKAGSFDAVLPPGDLWYLEFVLTPPPQPGPVSPITVWATEDIVATT